ncbi:hypothetical protein L1987_10531 [Smallanthus sonchifolius]|uniref:Uncharacterized protein n=1 Tax=Smallanthus sonchifolius TaxID=185202 RepID=A0ACB9JSC1_9ASTR|nr:hypothetical protein L1987_10531 [Smallanthus sonchifolius]
MVSQIPIKNLKEVRFNPNGVLELIDDTKKIAWSISSKDFGENSVSLRHLRMDQDGNLRIYSWDDDVHTWRIGWQAVEDQCNVFGSCGLYGVCGYNSTGPVCGCLYSDSLDGGNELPSPASGNAGCKKMVDLGNCKAHTSMLVMKQTVLYGLYPPHDVDMMLNEDECKEYCAKDATCYAMTSKNDGSGLCTLKRTVFVSGSTSPSIPSTSFLKVCLVPQAVAAKGANPNSTPKVVSFPFHGSCSSNESPSERDIYMLGKLLIEIVLLSREAVGDHLDQVMEKMMQEQKYLDSEDLRGVERVVRIALWCMQNQPFLRPSVGEVMKVLEGTLSVDRPPSSFAYRNGNDTEITVAGVGEIEPGS